jgi:hypothetical protein
VKKWQQWTGLAAGIATVIFLVLAYALMWWPVVTESASYLTRDGNNLYEHCCINNLRIINSAGYQYFVAQGKTNGTPITMDQIKPYIDKDYAADFGGNLYCPAGGTYFLAAIAGIGFQPTCSIGTNLLDSRVRNGYFHWANPRWHVAS